jgi:hypothetical protein
MLTTRPLWLSTQRPTVPPSRGWLNAAFPVGLSAVSSIDYLELIREAPRRIVPAKTSRVRRGNLIAGPDSAIVAFETGITECARRWTLTHQELQGLPDSERGHKIGRIESFVREISDVVTKPKDLLYIDRVQFLKDGDGRFVTRLPADPGAPRYPNDPAWPRSLRTCSATRD